MAEQGLLGGNYNYDPTTAAMEKDAYWAVPDASSGISAGGSNTLEQGAPIPEERLRMFLAGQNAQSISNQARRESEYHAAKEQQFNTLQKIMEQENLQNNNKIFGVQQQGGLPALSSQQYQGLLGLKWEEHRKDIPVDIAAHGDNRSERSLLMQEGKHSFDMIDKKNDLIVNMGMQKAAQAGGYEGVIDYLKTADPVKALAFTRSKIALDQDIMKNEIFQAAMPSMKAEAMLGGYAALGKAGQAILQAKPEDRESVYKNLLPMIKQVNPNAPEKLDQSAVDMFMLAGSQLQPQSQAAANDKLLKGFATTQGKYLADITKATQLYGANSPEVASLKNAASEASNAMDAAKIRQLRLQNTMMNQKQDQEKSLRQEASKLTEKYAITYDSYQVMLKNYQNIKTMPPGQLKGAADMTLVYNIMKMYDPTSNVMPGEYASATNAGGVPESVRAQYNSLKDGSILSDKVRDAFMDSAKTIFEQKQKSYYNIKNGILSIAQNQGLDVKNVFINRMGEDGQVSQTKNPYPDTAVDALMKYPHLAEQFQTKYGDLPDEFKQKIAEMQKDQQMNLVQSVGDVRRGRNQIQPQQQQMIPGQQPGQQLPPLPPLKPPDAPPNAWQYQ